MTVTVDEAQAVHAFYAASLDEAERLIAAGRITGLDQEIALLRDQLRDRKSEDFDSLLKGLRVLISAIRTRYQMKEDAADALAVAIAESAGRFLATVWPHGLEEEDV
jgi:hypothetical protein